jgi:hypothetical protein
MNIKIIWAFCPDTSADTRTLLGVSILCVIIKLVVCQNILYPVECSRRLLLWHVQTNN